jgi:t-SNARE complex subunit (syntaxin)
MSLIVNALRKNRTESQGHNERNLDSIKLSKKSNVESILMIFVSVVIFILTIVVGVLVINKLDTKEMKLAD